MMLAAPSAPPHNVGPLPEPVPLSALRWKARGRRRNLRGRARNTRNGKERDADEIKI
jgi:hypothetical protein